MIVNESYVTSQKFVNCFGSTTLHDKNFRPVQLSRLWNREYIDAFTDPGSPFRILSRRFGDKIRNREPGFEATFTVRNWCALD